MADELDRLHTALLEMYDDPENCPYCDSCEQDGYSTACQLHAATDAADVLARFMMGEDFGPHNEDKPFPKASKQAERLRAEPTFSLAQIEQAIRPRFRKVLDLYGGQISAERLTQEVLAALQAEGQK